MKTLRCVMLSYFQQPMSGRLIFLASVFGLFFATLLAFIHFKPPLPHEFKPWGMFFAALLYMVWAMTMHLKHVIRSRTGALLPHYRRRQLTAAGLVLGVFIFLPMVIYGLRGANILAPSAMFLLAAALMFWGMIHFEERVGIFIFVWPVIIVLGGHVHVLLGFKPRVFLFPWLAGSLMSGLKTPFALFIILLSCGLLFLFARYVSRMPYGGNGSDPGSMEHDILGRFSQMIVMRKMAVLRRKKGEQTRGSLLWKARMLQPALFSPGFFSVINSLIVMVGFLFFLYTYMAVFYGSMNLGEKEARFSIAVFCVGFYVLGAMMMSTNFLQHRHHMPGIWLRAPLDSRGAFARTTLLAYLLVALKQFLVVTAAVFIIHALLRAPLLKSVLVTLIGLAAYITFMALSILLGEAVVSHECLGWSFATMSPGMIFSAVVALSARGTGYLSEGIWWFALGLLGFSVVLLWGAYRKWSHTEMDFVGPATQAPY